ncbi:hypothetical protein LXL04_035934 [Taraxacum kok-saghyz]
MFVGTVGGEGDTAVPIRGSNKKLIEKVVNFLEADCYLYSPLVNNNDHVCSMSRLATPNSETEGGQIGELHPSSVVTGTVAYRESLKLSHTTTTIDGVRPPR